MVRQSLDQIDSSLSLEYHRNRESTIFFHSCVSSCKVSLQVQLNTQSKEKPGQRHLDGCNDTLI